MSDFNTGPRRRWIDQLADAGKPATANGNVGERSVWWWILLMPGKVILWLEYMFRKCSHCWNSKVWMVPVERIELPTFGLQSRRPIPKALRPVRLRP